MAAQHSQTADFETRYKFNDYGGKKIKYLFVERIQRSCELDQETGLYYYGARYYDPETSIWLSVDPLVEKYPGINPYVYTADNPVKFIDPDGQCFTKNSNGEYVPCPEGNEGDTRTGHFGFKWKMKNGEWQLNNNVDPNNVNYDFDYVAPDGSPEYYEIRYVYHIQKYGTKPPDYYLEYGYNNNKLFANHEWKTDKGREWTHQTAIRLQELMNEQIDLYPEIQGNNDKFTKMAYETHVPAYTYRNTILKLQQTNDLLAIPVIPKLKHSFGSSKGWGQILKMVGYFYQHSEVYSPSNPGRWKPFEPKF